MFCPVCRGQSTKVLDSRDSRDGGIRRRRQCLSCGHRFTTRERVEATMPVVIKRSGARQNFDRQKILSGLKLACRKRPVDDEQLEEIVHAVRAHHFDEQPNSDLAYLVIAADAMSGARPGARRSTIDSYNQKMADLQNIGNSFEGVVSTYILSAGREVRVVVDSGRVDDVAALDLSRKIAQKIEEECSYPGQIRVTVVRESQAVEYAR